MLDPGAPTETLSIPSPSTDDELHAFVLDTLGINIPRRSCCRGHSSPFAAFADSYFGRAPVTVWKASRGFGGKTYTLSALAFIEAITLRASVNLLGGSGEQSQRVLDYFTQFWLRPRAPQAARGDSLSRTRTNFLWGNTINALAASPRAVSGPHPQRLRCDEVDLMDLDILDQALGQPMSKDGVLAQTTLSSAHYEADGTFTEVLKRARQKGWPVHEWCWRECLTTNGGWLLPEEVERTRATVTATMFAVQYDLQEPSPEGRAVLTDKVEAMFLPVGKQTAGRLGARLIGEVELDDSDGRYLEIEPPVEGATYATGGDWAREAHDTVIITVRTDVTPMRWVAYQRFTRLPRHVMTERFNERVARYPGAASHDATGMGVLIKDDIVEGSAEHFTMVGQPRAMLFTDYIAGIEHGEVVAPRISKAYHDHRYVKNDDLFTRGGHPPDTFVGGAMAYRAATNGVPLRLLNRGTAHEQRARQVRESLDRVAALMGHNAEVSDEVGYD